jgi:prepilin-type N-terminal cleavage/methylation domain-containing protein
MSLVKIRGFTLVEILAVITLITVLSGLLTVGFRDYARYQQYQQAVSNVEANLKLAHAESRGAVNDQPHGVKISGGTLTRFVGDSYVVGDPSNVTITYSEVVFIPNLTGGTDEILFDILTGLPSATGTVLVEGVKFSASTTFTITNTGVIQ